MDTKCKNIPEELIRMEKWVSTYQGKKPTTPIYGKLFSFSSRTNPAFVINMTDDYCAIDIDDCIINTKTSQGKLDELVLFWVKEFNTYTEISRHGTGIHMVFKCDKSRLPNETTLGDRYWTKRDINKQSHEFYKDRHIIVLTGNVFQGRDKIREVPFETVKSFIEYIIPLKVKSVKPTGESVKMSDDEIISLISGSKQGQKFTALWNRDGIKGNSDGDMGLAGMLAFFTQNADQIVRIMKNAPCYRGKFDKHRTYLPRIAEKAIENRTGTYSGKCKGRSKSIKEEKEKSEPQKKIVDSEWDTDFLNDKGRPYLSLTNLDRLLKRYKIEIKFNEMSNELEINGKDFENAHGIQIRDLCLKHKFVGATISNVANYINAVSCKYKYHPVKEYFDKLEPVAGESEFKKLMDTLTLVNEEHRDYAEMVVRKWLISCVAALYEKRFKSQGVLTLQGTEGIFKSTWLANLCPDLDWFNGEFIGLDVNTRDSVQKGIKYWISELAELESTFKKDFVALKGFITNPYDEYRAAYAHWMEKHPRRTVFCASVNSLEFLKNDSGDRRFWVLELEKLDINTKIDLNSLWGEVKRMYLEGLKYYPNSEETIEIRQHNRTYTIKNSLDDYFMSLVDPDRSLSEYSGLQLLRMVNQNTQIRDVTTSQIGRSLSKLGYKSKPKKINGQTQRVYLLNIRPPNNSLFG